MRFTTRTAPGVKRLYRYASLPFEVANIIVLGGVFGARVAVCLNPESHHHPAERIEITFAGWTR